MAGNIFWKERAIVTLTSTGASLTNVSAGIANGTANLDVRTGGNAAGDFSAIFELICQWGTVTGIVAGTLLADLYLVPSPDGTNFPDLDLTAGASYISYLQRVGAFSATKAPTASTDARFESNRVELLPLLYKPYIINRSGQTISANWTLKVVSAQVQFS